VACTGTQSSPVLRRTFVPGDFVLSVVTPESRPGFAMTEVQRPAELAGQDQRLNLERAQVCAELFTRSGKNPASGLQPSLPPVSQKVLPGLEEALKIRADGVMGIFVCGSGPAVGILSHANPHEATRAVRRCFLDFGIPTTYGLFRPTNAGALELNAIMPQINLPASRPTGTRARRSV
jgi:homoserine kinase